jgi:hypothetical protein
VVVRRLFELVVLLCRSQGSKELEILVLRHELSILRLWARKYDPAANGHFRTADEFMHPRRRRHVLPGVAAMTPPADSQAISHPRWTCVKTRYGGWASRPGEFGAVADVELAQRVGAVALLVAGGASTRDRQTPSWLS